MMRNVLALLYLPFIVIGILLGLAIDGMRMGIGLAENFYDWIGD